MEQGVLLKRFQPHFTSNAPSLTYYIFLVEKFALPKNNRSQLFYQFGFMISIFSFMAELLLKSVPFSRHAIDIYKNGTWLLMMAGLEHIGLADLRKKR